MMASALQVRSGSVSLPRITGGGLGRGSELTKRRTIERRRQETPTLTLPRITGGGNKLRFRHLTCVVTIALACFAACAHADDAAPSGQDAAISRGLDFLASQQNPDGSFGPKQKPAITGLALMSFLAAGQTADVGRHGAIIRGAIEYLVSSAGRDGSFNPDHEEKPMYAQGIATLALAEAYGVEENEDYRRKIAGVLSRSVPMILKAQSVKKAAQFEGGWRYTVNAADSDLSFSGWNALALRSCQEAGLRVPADAVRRAGEFVLKCFDSKSKGFAYQPDGKASVGATAVAVLCLHVLDDPSTNFARRRETDLGAAFLESNRVTEKTPNLYYVTYYTTQAAWQLGGAAWSRIAYPDLARLLKLQQTDGGWPASDEGPGRAYTTSMALLSLTVSYHLLPIYQR